MLTLPLSCIDLRELDAVLSQSLSGITKRIEQLTDRIEGGLTSLAAMTNGQPEDIPGKYVRVFIDIISLTVS